MIFTPYRRHQLDLSPEQFNLPFWNNLDERSSPILSNSGGLMMSAMFSSHTFGDFINTQAVGPAEAFFAFASEGNTADESSDSCGDEAEDEAEVNLDISDFITCDSSDDEDDGDVEDNNEDAGDEQGHGANARPVTASSDTEVLSHLTAGKVASFRRDQLNMQLLLGSEATQDSLAFSGPFNHTALRGLKSDRFQTASAPMTPMRRQKRLSTDLSRSPLEAVSQKRKASGEHLFGHKRQRSISEVNLLSI